MRIYLPATPADLPQIESAPAGVTLPLASRRAHAVTAALRAALPEEDDEGLEYAAHLAACDDSLWLLADVPDAARQRLVVTLEVPDDDVVEVLASEAVLAPSAVQLSAGSARVHCLHVDEPDAVPDVTGALEGDDAALERLVERDLLWYDALEVGDIPLA